MDVEHAIDDTSYFPFDYELQDVVMAFSRDPWIFRIVSTECIPLIGGTPDGHHVGIFPRVVFNLFVAWFRMLRHCVTFMLKHVKYILSFGTVCSLWCSRMRLIRAMLHCNAQQAFEDLIQRYELELFRHLLEVGIAPLQLAFSWM